MMGVLVVGFRVLAVPVTEAWILLSILRIAPLGSAGWVQVRVKPVMQTGAMGIRTLGRTLMVTVWVVVMASAPVWETVSACVPAAGKAGAVGTSAVFLLVLPLGI